MRTLRPWQEEAIAYLHARQKRNKGGFLYMEMRLGKTLAMLRFLNTLTRAQSLFPTLVLTPNTVKRTWGNEIKSEDEHDYVILSGVKDERNYQLHLNCKYTICNFESIIPIKKKIKTKDEQTGEEKIDVKKYAGVAVDKYPFKSIVIDESQRAGNNNSVAKYLLTQFKHVPFKFLLSGLPAPESEMQYCNQFILGHGHFMYYRNFYSFRVGAYEKQGYEWLMKPGTRDELYKFVHENAFIKTRADAGLPDLKEYTRRYVKMSKEQETAYKSMLNKYEYNGVEAINDLSQAMYLQQLAGGIDISHPESPWLGTAKFELIKEMLQGELAGDSVMIWSRYNAEAILAWKYLNLLGFKCELVHGETSDDELERIRTEFNAKRIQVVCATIKKLSSGTNWAGADTAVYVSNEFSNDLRSQSEDRIYDVLKTYPLLIIDIITERTVDESIVDMLVDKKIDARFFLTKLYGEIKRMQNAF